MHVIARSSHAACHSFFTVRRVTSVCARRSTALVLTRTASIQSKFSGMPRLGCSSCPPYCAIAVSEGENALGGERSEERRVGREGRGRRKQEKECEEEERDRRRGDDGAAEQQNGRRGG